MSKFQINEEMLRKLGLYGVKDAKNPGSEDVDSGDDGLLTEPGNGEIGEGAEETEAAPEKQVLLRMERRRELRPLYDYCKEVKEIASGLEKGMFQELWTDRVLLLSVNLGAGINSYSSIYFDFLLEEELLPGEGGGAEIKLDEREGHGLSLTEAKRFIVESGGAMFSIDLTEWCDHIQDEEFREFLLFLYSQAESLRYVFRIPYLEKKEVEKVAAVLSDIFTVDSIIIPPVRRSEIRETAATLLSEYGCTASEEAMEIFEKRLSEERSDGRFYGMNTVEKVIREMVVEKLRRNADGEEVNLIYAADMKNILSAPEEYALDPEEELRNRVAMKEINEQLNQILADMEEQQGSYPYYHMRFIGRPGSGRTETARLFGEILKKRGILSGSGFLEYRGEELLGRVSGETTAKTMSICRDAEGCVLFIDGLSLEKKEQEDDLEENTDYRREAIETLLSRVEAAPDAFLLIFAGTEEELKNLEREYPVILKLLPNVLRFPDYNKEELAEIFFNMAEREQLTLTEECRKEVSEYFSGLSDKWMEREDFASARFVRNLFERTKSKAALRQELYDTEDKSIFPGDFRLAAMQNQELLNQKSEKKYPMGFRLRDL